MTKPFDAAPYRLDEDSEMGNDLTLRQQLEKYIEEGTESAIYDTARLFATLRSHDALVEALLGTRDTDDEEGDPNWRDAGPCWCPAFVHTVKVGHSADCMRARAALAATRGGER